MIYYIYKHELNEKCYIGYTKKAIEERLSQHISSGRKSYFSSAIKKYGKENIKTTCLEIIESENSDIVKEREKYWIFYYKTNETGYNLTDGGDGGDTWSKNKNKESTRIKMSKSSSGRKHTEEARRKMSEYAKNKRPPQSKEAIDRAEAKRKIKRETGNYISEDGKRRLSEFNKNKQFSEESKKKLSISAYNREKVTCEYCGKHGQRNGMSRWHFENCKRNLNEKN